MNPSFEVTKFSGEFFSKELPKINSISKPLVIYRNILRYLYGYLEHLKCETIVIEYDYIDRDYLEGYAGYYARCFSGYERKCIRLHFFKIKFSSEEFQSLISHGNFPLTRGILQYAYLGFIVLRPLPYTIIGRTCLSPYPLEERRYFPVKRSRKVSLFGIELKIDTLPFQEQDRVVAACATSALWTVFQKTGELFNHHMPSPMEITKTATLHSPIETRTFPNREGLSHFHMVQAMQNVYLEPIRININPLENKNCERLLKANSYAYLQAHIPLIMTFYLYDPSDDKSFLKELHGVAITGFCIDKDISHSEPFGFNLKAYRMSKIYVHDDQVGPFVRMEYDKKTISIGKTKNIYSLSTQWQTKDEKDFCRGMPNILLVPLYHKIRIPFEAIFEKVQIFNILIKSLYNIILSSKKMKAKDIKNVLNKLEWDIYLTTVNEFKENIFSLGYTNFRGEILLSKMPKFIWRATLIDGKSTIMDLIFDATDIEQGDLHLTTIEYDKELANTIRAATKVSSFIDQFYNSPASDIVEWFKNNK